MFLRHAGAIRRLSLRAVSLLAGAAVLASCTLVQRQPPAAVEERGAVPPAPSASAASAVALPAPPGTLERAHARWVPASFAELPGWGQDRVAEVWPALRLGCSGPAAPLEAWAAVCTQSRQFYPADDAQARQWLEQRLKVYRLESPEGEPGGLATGYFEPLVEASRKPTRSRRVPLYAPPADLGIRKPYWTRQELDTVPAAQAGLKGREIAFVDDPMDALLLQVQGSGRVMLAEGGALRLNYAAQNGRPYTAIGAALIAEGAIAREDMSMQAIRAWLAAHPERASEIMNLNESYVFFRELPLDDPAAGPPGAPLQARLAQAGAGTAAGWRRARRPTPARRTSSAAGTRPR